MAFDGFGLLYLGSLFAGYALAGEPAHPQLSVGVDRQLPTQDDRQLRTTTLHLFLREKEVEPLRLHLRLGLGVTRVSGHITQLTGSYEEGTLREVVLDSPAWGAGPEVEASFRLFRYGPLTAQADLLGGVYLYDRDFPAGGRRYNGMLQAGLSLNYAFSPQDGVTLGYRWMHVSNGQGVQPSNPSYEAAGISLRYVRRF